MEVEENGTEEVTFERDGDLVLLSGSGRLQVLNDVRIDLANQVVLVEDIVLDEMSTIDVETDSNSLKSKWKGYSWDYSLTNRPNGLADFESIEDMASVTIVFYSFVVGRLERDGRIYMVFKKKAIIKGVPSESIEIPFLLRNQQ